MVRRLFALLAVLALAACLPVLAWAGECPAGGSHEYEVQLVRHATETEDGLRVFTCVKCGYTYEDAIPKTGHDWGPWIRDIDPTCTTDGLEHRICRNATHVEHREERVLPALSVTGEHTWVEVWREDAACEADGLVEYECSVCGARQEQVFPALGHAWGAWEAQVDAQGHPTGIEESVCLRDAGHVRTREAPVPAAESAPAPISRSNSAGAGSGSVAGSVAPSPGEEVPDAWDWGAQFTPNTLDAVLAVGDGVALVSFLGASVPLFFQLAWIRRRRNQAGEQGAADDSYGLMAPGEAMRL